MGGAGALGSRCVSCYRFCGAAKVVWHLFSSVPKLKNKMHDASPGAVGSSSRTWRLVSLSFWSREDTGCWREKKAPRRAL